MFLASAMLLTITGLDCVVDLGLVSRRIRWRSALLSMQLLACARVIHIEVVLEHLIVGSQDRFRPFGLLQQEHEQYRQ